MILMWRLPKRLWSAPLLLLVLLAVLPSRMALAFGPPPPQLLRQQQQISSHYEHTTACLRVKDSTTSLSSSSSSPAAFGDVLLQEPLQEHEEDTGDEEEEMNEWEQLLDKISLYLLDPEDLALVEQAYMHGFPLKKSTESWTHAVGVAHVLADLKLDAVCLATALLRANPKNSTDSEERKNKFQEEEFEMQDLLLGLKAMDLIQFQFRHHQQKQQSSSIQQHGSENYRKMMVTLAKDIRVLLIKLAEQTQTLRMLEEAFIFCNETSTTGSVTHATTPADNDNPRKKEAMVAQEALQLYAPLSHRLGMHTLKTEMEDVSLKLWNPTVYHQLQQLVAARETQRQAYTQQVVESLQACLAKEGGAELWHSLTITGRPKSLYSIYQKMQSQNLAFSDIQDLMAFRILVDNVPQCYQALGIVHARFQPCGVLKDYIAMPKPNGYQSLHTTVMGPQGKRMEVQIRTYDMHSVAEGGVAAHWMYKSKGKRQKSSPSYAFGDNSNKMSDTSERGKAAAADAERYRWLRQLVEWAQIQEEEDEEEGDGVDTITQTQPIRYDEVFVFSPQGQLLALRKGSCILDYAYHIHSGLGDHCVGGKVNGKMVKLNHVLENGDKVEILKSAQQTPKQEWLQYVQTTKAQQRIRSWLKKQQIGEDSIALGREILETAIVKYSKGQQQLLMTGNHGVVKEYKKYLDRVVLDKLDLEDENSLYQALAYGGIRAKTVAQEMFAAAASSRVLDAATTAEADDFIANTIATISSETTTKSNTHKRDGIVIGGQRNILLSFCRNCNPLYGEAVQGFVTQGRGVKVHTIHCRYLQESDHKRRVDAIWDPAAKLALRTRATRLEVLLEDAPGMLAAMSAAISTANVNIAGVVAKTLSNGRGLVRFDVLLGSVDDLERVTQNLLRVQGVLGVERR